MKDNQQFIYLGEYPVVEDDKAKKHLYFLDAEDIPEYLETPIIEYSTHRKDEFYSRRYLNKPRSYFSKRIFMPEDLTPHPNTADLVQAIVNPESYFKSKRDTSKDQLVPYTFEEFEIIFNEQLRRAGPGVYLTIDWRERGDFGFLNRHGVKYSYEKVNRGNRYDYNYQTRSQDYSPDRFIYRAMDREARQEWGVRVDPRYTRDCDTLQELYDLMTPHYKIAYDSEGNETGRFMYRDVSEDPTEFKALH